MNLEELYQEMKHFSENCEDILLRNSTRKLCNMMVKLLGEKIKNSEPVKTGDVSVIEKFFKIDHNGKKLFLYFFDAKYKSSFEKIMKIFEDHDFWRIREKEAMDSDKETFDVWWKYGLEPIKDHFPALSKDAEGMMTYIQTPEKGYRNIRNRLSPGRYLGQFYSHLNSETIKNLISHFKDGNTLKFAYTEEEILKVYYACNESGNLGSCMTKKPGSFLWGHSKISPMACYATGDWAIAYLENSEGKIVARTICAPERMIHHNGGYGDITRLFIHLERAGFKVAIHGYDDFKGLRLKKIVTDKKLKMHGYLSNEIKDEIDYYTIPSIDFNFSLVDMDEDFFMLSNESSHRRYEGHGEHAGTPVFGDSSKSNIDYLNNHILVEREEDYKFNLDVTKYKTVSIKDEKTIEVENLLKNYYFCNGYKVWFNKELNEFQEINGKLYVKSCAENKLAYMDFCKNKIPQIAEKLKQAA